MLNKSFISKLIIILSILFSGVYPNESIAVTTKSKGDVKYKKY